MLQIYNSLTKQKQQFTPIYPGKVGIYVCGMTVYDYCHLGHARVMVAFDAVVKHLRVRGYEVNYVRNITDIDDKIINRANENDEDFNVLTKRFISAMHEDAERIGVAPPDSEPRATAYMGDIIKMIQSLIDKGFAYVAENGDVYYDVTHFKTYGKLAKRNLDDMQAGARVDIIDVKHNPLDFALWKMAKPGEPSWESPWGEGRPGWHIECSAMSTQCLGDHFDIHGGGFDLIFPHHENEIAQSEAATGETFVNTWMHVGYLQINREKMSKSLGNFFTIREVLDKYPAEVVRYFLVSSHYRSQLNYSIENLEHAMGGLQRLYNTIRGVPKSEALKDSEFETKFNAAMDDDFNIPEAIAALYEISREINRVRDQDADKAGQLAALLINLGEVLGILQQDPETFLQGDLAADAKLKIEGLIAQRKQAREDKDWATADKVRDEIVAMGIELEDSSEGTKWRKISEKL